MTSLALHYDDKTQSTHQVRILFNPVLSYTSWFLIFRSSMMIEHLNSTVIGDIVINIDKDIFTVVQIKVVMNFFFKFVLFLIVNLMSF